MKNIRKEKPERESPLDNLAMEKSHYIFDEIWDKALEEIENKEIEEVLKSVKELKEEARLEREYIMKHGKEPEARTPDGKINKKYIDYVLRRDFDIEPDPHYPNPYEKFSWGGLTGEEAFIAYWNCE